MPPKAAATGTEARRQDPSSPEETSRRISTPTSGKNTAMRAWFVQSRNEKGKPTR
jgi:hypothetical protein